MGNGHSGARMPVQGPAAAAGFMAPQPFAAGDSAADVRRSAKQQQWEDELAAELEAARSAMFAGGVQATVMLA